jgi:tetratricopeptide (TPR) repeat protein
MLVTPTTSHFELVYSERALDWFALSTTWLGLLWTFAAVVSPRVRRGSSRAVAAVFRPVGEAFVPVRVPANVVLVLVCIGASALVRYEIRDVDKTYREGQTAFSEKRYEDVIRVHSEFVKNDEDRPKIATALLQLGTAYSELGRPELAIEAFERLRFDFPNIDYAAHSFFHLAKNYVALKDEARAREYALQLEKGYPDSGWLKRLRKEMPTLLPPAPPPAPAATPAPATPAGQPAAPPSVPAEGARN